MSVNMCFEVIYILYFILNVKKSNSSLKQNVQCQFFCR
jgi:hypothetical protein